jgi:type I restriction enzyme S subunit
MAGEWRDVLLEDVAEDVTVGHVGPMASEYVDRGVPFLRSQDVEPLRINDSGIKFITPSFHERLSKSALSPGDVVIVRTGNPGTCAVIPGTLPVANCADLVIVRCGTGLDPRFLAYYMNSVASHHIDSHLVGAVQQHFNVGSARKMRMHLPELSEQRAITHILGTLDDKIELNRRMSETLESMARALFKSWFIDFDPVRAKAKGRDPGLPKPLADLFPSRLVDSDLGEIPEGWEVKSLDEIARFLNGLALQKYPPIGDRSLPAIKIAQLRAGNTSGADRANAELDLDYIVKNGDILFSWSGSLECVLWAGGDGALNQHLFKVTSGTHPRWLCYLGVHQHLERFREIAAGKATTMGHIQRHHLSEAKLAVPTGPLLRAISTSIELIVETIWKRDVQSHTLAALRDTLLPKLISGELPVKDAERFAATAEA